MKKTIIGFVLLVTLALSFNGCALLDPAEAWLDEQIAAEEAAQAAESNAVPVVVSNTPPVVVVTNAATEDGWPAELAQVNWLNANVRYWPATATITGAKIGNRSISSPYDKANVWPAMPGDAKKCNANPWAIVKVNGEWYACTYEWLAKGSTTRPMSVLDRSGGKGDHFKRAPLSSWIPHSGESFYVMVSTPARDTRRTVNERSNPVKVTWP